MICRKCKKDLGLGEFPGDKSRPSGVYPHCKVCNRARVKGYRDRIKKLVLNHYSDSKLECSCCGENIYEFLVLDHVNGGGNKHRKELNGGPEAVYRWVVKNNYPIGFRVLCASCNHAIGIYGACPHARLVQLQ